jgi:hypothetical protein
MFRPGFRDTRLPLSGNRHRVHTIVSELRLCAMAVPALAVGPPEVDRGEAEFTDRPEPS